MNTYATNPGNMRIKPLRVLYHTPGPTLLAITAGAALLAFGYFANNIIATIAGGLCLGALFWIVDQAKYRFTQGDVNIAKVLSLNPPLFATSTNMRTGMSQLKYPVIKITRGKVPNVRGRRYVAGDYFPAACLYSGPLGKPHWQDFFPVPLSVATDDAAVIDYHAENLEDLHAEFEARLALVETPAKPGLYFIDEQRLGDRVAFRSYFKG